MNLRHLIPFIPVRYLSFRTKPTRLKVYDNPFSSMGSPPTSKLRPRALHHYYHLLWKPSVYYIYRKFQDTTYLSEFVLGVKSTRTETVKGRLSWKFPRYKQRISTVFLHGVWLNEFLSSLNQSVNTSDLQTLVPQSFRYQWDFVDPS